MSLSRPGWFADLCVRWPAVLGPELSDHVEPLGVDTEGRLHVRCTTPPWATQVALLSETVTIRINASLADGASITGITVTSSRR
ncbi:DciA family protein [Streptomyces mauvecolor]|uniref:DciA family protein n=1 Tax=Streptomyces mauvecolor TaxID=58345 RepID=A0ABV9UH26_9ACTN